MANFSTSLRGSTLDGKGTFADYVDSLPEDEKGNLDPSNPKHANLLNVVTQAITSGQLDEARVQKLMRRNPSAAPVMAAAWDAGMNSRNRKQILGQYFSPAQSELPEQTGYVNLPGGQVMEQKIQGREAIPSVSDTGGAVTALLNTGDIEGAKELMGLAGKKGDSPAAIQEYQFWKSLPDDKARTDYMHLKRQGYRIENIAGVPSMAPTLPGLPVVPLSTLTGEVSGKSAIEGGKKAAEVKAGAQAQAEIDLGSNLDEIQKMREGVRGFLTAPGFNNVYGLTRPVAFIPSTDAANAETRREQLQAQSFMISIQKMKGGGLGSLSDAEGKKLDAAYTRATNPKQSPKAARDAWVEVERYLNLAEKRAIQKAGKQPESVEPTPQPQGFRVIRRK